MSTISIPKSRCYTKLFPVAGCVWSLPGGGCMIFQISNAGPTDAECFYTWITIIASSNKALVVMVI